MDVMANRAGFELERADGGVLDRKAGTLGTRHVAAERVDARDLTYEVAHEVDVVDPLVEQRVRRSGLFQRTRAGIRR